MKKYLLGAAALLAFVAPGVASAQQSGYVDLGYQTTEADIAGVEGDGEGWTLGGATAWGGDGTVGVQLDGVIGEADESSSYNVGGHLFTRNGDCSAASPITATSISMAPAISIIGRSASKANTISRAPRSTARSPTVKATISTPS